MGLQFQTVIAVIGIVVEVHVGTQPVVVLRAAILVGVAVTQAY
jgi:hypothetical protein